DDLRDRLGQGAIALLARLSLGAGRLLAEPLRALLAQPQALGHVADDRQAADDLPRVAVQGRVTALEEPLPARLRHRVRARLGADDPARGRPEGVPVGAGLPEEGEDVEATSAEPLGRADARDQLHPRVPDGIAALAVEGEDAVDAAIDPPLGELLGPPQG